MWYNICQWNFVVGVVVNFMTLAILTSNVVKRKVRMSPTVHMAAECFSAIAGPSTADEKRVQCF